MAQNNRRAKLRGKSFKGQDLTGVDFSYSDIRGADFTGANLKGANFSYVQAGLQRRWATILLIFSLLLSTLSGLFSAIGGSLLGFILINEARENFYIGVATLIVLSIFFLVTMGRGVTAGAGFLFLTVLSSGVAAVLWAGIVALSWAGIATAETMELAAVVAVVVTGAVAVVVVATGAVLVAVAAALAGAVAGLVAVTTTVAIAGAVSGAMAVFASKVNPVAGGVAAGVAILVVLLSVWVGCRALFGDEKQALVRNTALSMATKWSTRFNNSDLTDADFSQATLKNCNFLAANLTRTNWSRAQKLNLAAVATTYLDDKKMRQLLITKDLQGKNLDGWNLQNINLQGANFRDATLAGAKLNNSNLQEADFSRATLIKADVDNANFRKAILTGAYVGDWGVTTETKLDGIKCDYIFLRIPTKEEPNPHRQPPDWEENFREGEFAKRFSVFKGITQVVNTD